MKQNLEMTQRQERDRGDNDWKANEYQLTRRFRTLIKWATGKHIGQTAFLHTLQNVMSEDENRT